MRPIIAAILSVQLLGCASYFKRKECEKTNWHQYGHDVAMTGRRLDTDSFIKDCQKVEAHMSFSELDLGFKAGMQKYCTQDNIFEVGKAGKPFSYEMCDGESLKKMRAQYQKGLDIFCTPANAYRFGSAGGVYQNVCPKSLESDWLAEYRKGRKVWLTGMIAEKERESQQLDRELLRLEQQRAQLSHQQIWLSGHTEVRTERIFDSATGTYKEQTVRGPSENTKRRLDQISSELRSLGWEMDRVRGQQKEILDEVRKMRTEMISL